ncbi:hypothetical protein [Treponema sp.]|uniref:hypothetical protein n=1 Tax=Treponema sp. TaxID=166 RepID=UPI0036DF2FAC
MVPRNSDVFAMQKLVVRTPKDGRDINQKRVLYKTRLFPTYTEVCREKVYTDVHFWTVYFKRLTESMFYDMLLLKMLNVSERPRTGVVRSSSDVFAQQKLAFKN